MPGSRSLTVAAADDHPVVLAGIRLLLRAEPAFNMTAETRDAATTLDAIRQIVPDILILDLWMGGNDGLDLLKQIRAHWPSIRVLVYSMNDERVFGRRVLQAGAAGYLTKSHGLDELLRALRIVADGERYLSAALAAELTEAALYPALAPAKPAGQSRYARLSGGLSMGARGMCGPPAKASEGPIHLGRSERGF